MYKNSLKKILAFLSLILLNVLAFSSIYAYTFTLHMKVWCGGNVEINCAMLTVNFGDNEKNYSKCRDYFIKLNQQLMKEDKTKGSFCLERKRDPNATTTEYTVINPVFKMEKLCYFWDMYECAKSWITNKGKCTILGEKLIKNGELITNKGHILIY